jgi:hypothetical protein
MVLGIFSFETRPLSVFDFHCATLSILLTSFSISFSLSDVSPLQSFNRYSGGYGPIHTVNSGTKISGLVAMCMLL